MKISVVIAAYNEAENIGHLTSRLIATLDSISDATWELIYVIEGDDETRTLAQSFAAARPEINIIYNLEPSGLANAFRKGFGAVAADADVVVTMDADLNHQPEEIPRLVNALFDKSADIVVGSRKVEGSTTTGTPLWKRSLSDTVNRTLRNAIGMPVADLTSGFRVYTRKAFDQLWFSNNGFAFLPEILMRAHDRGERICEQPIDFKFRIAGESKMNFVSTGLSYLRLFGTRALPSPAILAALLIVIAIVIRLVLAYPVHKYQADADGVLSGLCAMQVLDGSHPVFFPGGYRLGAQSCYVTAAAFSVFGVSRAALALTGLLFSSLFVLFMYLYLREAFGSRSSLIGLLLAAVPSWQIMINTYVPWAYGEILMYCASTLWLGVRLDRRKSSVAWFGMFGLSAGLAFWCSMQSLMITLPLFAWLALRGPLRSRANAALVTVGLLMGSAPLWLSILSGKAGKILGDPNLGAAHSVSQILANSTYLVSVEVPWLLAETRAAGLSHFSSATLALLVYSAASLMLLYLAVWPKSRRRGNINAQATLLLMIVLCCAGLYVFSAAGSVRGWTTRYVLPMYLVVPGLFALSSAALKRKWQMVMLMGAVVFLSWINIRNYPLPRTQLRQSLRASLVADRKLISWLKQNHISAVLGDYWVVYGLNFDSDGSIAGIPVVSNYDYLAIAPRLRRTNVRWAILDLTPDHLTRWQRRLELQGHIFSVSEGRFLLMPDMNPPVEGAEGFLKLARAVNPP